MKRKCPPGKYYCYTDKKCKKIPKGFKVVGRMGYLRRENGFSKDENETKKNGNGSSNGNGNGGNGAGNGNGGSGGNGGGNGGGGMGESVVYEKLDRNDKPFIKKLVGKLRKGSKTHAKQADDLEKAMTEESNPRIPRKAGQPAKSKKHSDLYTDEDPKGTIHGLGFKNVAKARASVSKIRNSSRSHAHKIQAAVAMEQRAREMGKTSEAAVYRKYINSMKKKTKRMNEAVNAAQQAAIAIDMKKKGKKPKSMKEGMYNHTDVGLITNAVVELEDGLKTLKTITYDSVDQLMQGIAKRNDISPTLLHNQFKAKHFTIPDNWAIRYRMNKMKGIEEATMTPAQKRKDTRLKKKYDKSDMKKSMQKQYGKEEGKKVYFATIRKQAMGEENVVEKRNINPMEKKLFDRQNPKDDIIKAKPADAEKENKLIDKYSKKYKTPQQKTDTQQKLRDMSRGEYMDDDYKYNVSEEGLRDWFGKSSGTTKSGRKVRGWVQVGGKYDGKPCARQPGQKSTPKCVSSSKRRSMSKSERDSAARRKRAADPNQPQKSGAAKPTNVSTDPKRKMKENYFNRNKEVELVNEVSKKTLGNYIKKASTDLATRSIKHGMSGGTETGGDPDSPKNVEKINKRHSGIMKAADKLKKEEFVNEAKDKKGKGSGTKDACYHKVKSRYSVWPSAYASGALVKCRKVGAANWGNKSKNEGFSPMQVAALEAAGMIEIKEGKKCWKGYKKAGTQKLFGKTYNRCVKAGDELNHDGESLQEMPSFDIKQTKTQKLQKMAQSNSPNEAEIAKKKLDQKQAKEPKLPTLNNSYAPVTEGVAFLKRKKEEKKKSSSEYLTQRDAGKLAKRKMAKKDQEKVNFLEPEETNESKTRLVKNGHTYKVVLTWRGKTYMVQMFVPSVSRPTRQQVEKEVQKIYPDAKLMSFLPRDLEPGEPTVMMGEEQDSEINKKIKNIKDDPRLKKIEKDPQGAEIKSKIEKETGTNIKPFTEGKKVERDEYGDIVGGPKISKKQKAKNLAKNEKDEQHTTTTSEAYSSKPSNLKKKAKLTAALNRLQDLKVKKKMGEEYISELSPATLGSYVKKAKDSLVNYERERAPLNYIKHNKMINRDIGIDRASDKLVKKAEPRKPENKRNVMRGASPDSTQSFSQEEYVTEDDMKGMSVKSGHKRPTKAGAGMTKKGVEAYRRRNPGSKLKTAVTTKPSKLKKGSKAANRRKSYCARSAGQMKKFPKAAKDPNSRLRQARRRWNC